jgi:hypothetical protein
MEVAKGISKALLSYKDATNKLFLTLTCPLAVCDRILPVISQNIDVLLLQLPDDHLPVKHCEVVEELLGKIDQHEHIRSTGACGFSNLDVLDAFILTHKPQHLAKFKYVSLHLSNLPNVYSISLELVHSYGLNAMLTFPSDFASTCNESKLYCTLAYPYKISPAMLLLKSMLQLGALVVLPTEPEQQSAEQPVLELLQRLGHPFVHRKTYVSAFRVISLNILDEHLDQLLAASEELELALDRGRQPLAITAPMALVLSYGPSS